MENEAKIFWNERALLGSLAGTNDFILTEIEQQFLLKNIPVGSRVLDMGCGNGASLIRLVTENNCHGVGFDFAEKMVESAKNAVRDANLDQAIALYQRTLPSVFSEWGAFDVIYSQRSLINLKSLSDQKDAVLAVADTLESVGIYIMIECFNEGAEETNLLRRRFGLEPILAPWHNLFFDLHEVKSWSSPAFYIENVVHISSTYHFLSRVVYAMLAAEKGEQLIYDSDINRIGALLPQTLGEFGPVKACIWRKK